METWAILIISIGLAMDCFAVAIGVGTNGFKKSGRMVLRLAFHFGLFQGAMTFAGWLAGRQIAGIISRVDHWVAFVLLAWVGGKMVIDSFKKTDTAQPSDPTRGGSLVMLSLATSIDAMAVGLSLAMVNGSIVVSSIIVGFVSFFFSVLGYLLGDKLGQRFGQRMQLVGGMILILIGLRVILSHLGISTLS